MGLLCYGVNLQQMSRKALLTLLVAGPVDTPIRLHSEHTRVDLPRQSFASTLESMCCFHYSGSFFTSLVSSLLVSHELD